MAVRWFSLFLEDGGSCGEQVKSFHAAGATRTRRTQRIYPSLRTLRVLSRRALRETFSKCTRRAQRGRGGRNGSILHCERCVTFRGGRCVKHFQNARGGRNEDAADATVIFYAAFAACFSLRSLREIFTGCGRCVKHFQKFTRRALRFRGG